MSNLILTVLTLLASNGNYVNLAIRITDIPSAILCDTTSEHCKIKSEKNGPEDEKKGPEGPLSFSE